MPVVDEGLVVVRPMEVLGGEFVDRGPYRDPDEVVNGVIDPHLDKYRNDDGSIDMRELSHRYSGQCIGVPVINKLHTTIVPVQVIEFSYKGVDGGGVNLVLAGQPIGTDNYVEYVLNDIICKWDIPDMGLINYKDTVTYITYGASRVWRRGLSIVNMTISDPNKYESVLLRENGDRRGLNPTKNLVAHDLFNPVYFTMDKALELLESGMKRSAAISPKYFISISALSDDIMVGYKDNLIGDVVGDKIYLNHGARHLYEELSEYYPCEIKKL